MPIAVCLHAVLTGMCYLPSEVNGSLQNIRFCGLPGLMDRK